MSLQNPDTRERILQVATDLFADRGFDGASVRAIAKKANVNLAAVNYHFSNKQNLYYEVLRHGIAQLTFQMETLAQEKKRTTVEFSQNLYEMLLKNGPQLINNFKVLLNDFPLPGDLITNQQAGPPGSEYILAILEQELGKKLSESDGLWAVRTIFTFIVHTALIASTHLGKQNCRHIFETKVVEKHIARLVKSILREMA
ncbi:MAG: TetR/AcrR family transcriptional regulator [Bdellovibrio sp.]|nr:TetR/AcrR family transcriptional regulator [Bdellovibrio sp.]